MAIATEQGSTGVPLSRDHLQALTRYIAYRSPDRYYTPAMMSTRGTNEIFVYGGSNANSNPVPTSSYVACIEPGTLKELWR